MAIRRDHPYGAARFLVEIDGLDASAFTEVVLPELAVEPVAYREGGEKETTPRQLPMRPTVGRLLLRRGFAGDLALSEWMRQTVCGERDARRNVSVHLLDEAATGPVATWRLRGAFPVRHSIGPLVAAGCGVVLEELEVACEMVDLT